MCKKKLPAKESPDMRKARVENSIPQRPKRWSGKAKLSVAADRKKTKKDLKDLH